MLIPGKFHLGMTGAEWWEGFSEGDAGEEAGGGGWKSSTISFWQIGTDVGNFTRCLFDHAFCMHISY